MNSEAINPEEFQDTGPLVMQARVKGRLKHALDDDKSFSLKEVQFDPKQNEICLIGSDVEQLVGMSQLSLMSGEKSAEAPKAPRKYPTMASEAKKAEAAAKEAQRVAENERMIAICAKRRRAKEEAQRAALARAAAEAQRVKANQLRSEGQKSDDSKSDGKVASKSERIKPTSSMSTQQETQVSAMSQGGGLQQGRQATMIQSQQIRKSETLSSRYPKTAAMLTEDERPPYYMPRKKLFHDQRTTDGIGIRYQATKFDTASNSSASQRVTAPSYLPELGDEEESP
ncbi:unnamed protein product [Strongylus vulgaris]|uniref:Uncharacterized protein n=1 Tax=Strongylus vulgaris TaxID=40348 RepID=A0A3P7KIT5_STRVU|nr:unnamed protein product [Strongylus vulgaris]